MLGTPATPRRRFRVVGRGCWVSGLESRDGVLEFGFRVLEWPFEWKLVGGWEV